MYFPTNFDYATYTVDMISGRTTCDNCTVMPKEESARFILGGTMKIS